MLESRLGEMPIVIDIFAYLPAILFLALGLSGFLFVLIWLAIDADDMANKSRP